MWAGPACPSGPPWSSAQLGRELWPRAAPAPVHLLDLEPGESQVRWSRVVEAGTAPGQQGDREECGAGSPTASTPGSAWGLDLQPQELLRGNALHSRPSPPGWPGPAKPVQRRRGRDGASRDVSSALNTEAPGPREREGRTWPIHGPGRAGGLVLPPQGGSWGPPAATAAVPQPGRRPQIHLCSGGDGGRGTEGGPLAIPSAQIADPGGGSLSSCRLGLGVLL